MSLSESLLSPAAPKEGVPRVVTPPYVSPVRPKRVESLHLLWATINLVATTIGAGILSVPISFAYCGSYALAILLLFAFGVLSAASLRFIAEASDCMAAPSYFALGEACFGASGASAVLWSLLGLLGGAFVQILIVIIDLTEMLIAKWSADGCAPARPVVAFGIAILSVPLCLPTEILELRFISSASVVCILFTCACIVAAAADYAAPQDGRGDEPLLLLPAETGPQWPLALPIYSLAYCSQFQIIDVAKSLPPTHRRAQLSSIVTLAIGLACGLYALVGAVCYSMLGARTLQYPNVLTAFGDNALVLAGSSSIAIVNYLKLPLVLLPLRSLLLERLGVDPPPSGWRHVALTFGMVGVLASAAVLAGSLALAFQLAGSTAGVSVCFILPGLLYARALRCQSEGTTPVLGDGGLPIARGGAAAAAAEAAAGSGGGGGGGGDRMACAASLMPRSRDEGAGVAMALAGLATGLACLWVLLVQFE